MSSIAAWISLSIAVILFLGSAAVYLRGSRDKGTIDALERNNKALTDRVTILEADAVKSNARIEALERENATLLSQRPSAEAIEDMRQKLHQHDEDTRKLLRAIVANIGREKRDE